jgi:uncharacterized protein
MSSYKSFARMEELDSAECLELLTSKKVGRVAWCGGKGPQVLPVNYAVVDGEIYFRTSPHSQLARALYESQVAFEVDEIDDFLETGWSVLVVGEANHHNDSSDLPPAVEDRPRPWAPGVRNLYVRITPSEITGRRLHPI